MTYPGPPEQPQQPGQQPAQPYGTPPGYGAPAGGQPVYGTPPPPPGYPAAPPPGYPTPPGYGAYGEPPKKKRRRWPWIVLAVVVVLVGTLIVIGLVFGREGSGTPKEAVDKFWTALVAHDTGKAENYVCTGKDLTGKNDTAFQQLVDNLAGYDVGPEAGSGGERTFPVTVHLTPTEGAQDLIITTTVKKQTGKWYVCDLST